MNQQNEKNNACLIFRSVYEAAMELDKDMALELLLTYIKVGLEGKESVNLDDCSQIVRLIVKQNIPYLEAAERRNEANKKNGQKGKENGGGIGRPRKSESHEDYQKRLEEWKQSKNPQITHNNPQQLSESENHQETINNPVNNPLKTQVIEKSCLQPSQNPQKPLEKEKEIEYEKEKEIEKENIYLLDFLSNPSKDYSSLLGNTSYFLQRNNEDLQHTRDMIRKNCGYELSINQIVSKLQVLYAEKGYGKSSW